MRIVDIINIIKTARVQTVTLDFASDITGLVVDHDQTDVTSRQNILAVDLAPTHMGEVMAAVRTHTALCPAAGATWVPVTILNHLVAWVCLG